MYFQKTLCSTVTFEGIGLHGGGKTRAVLSPAPVDTGLVFYIDGTGIENGIKAHLSNLLNTRNAITIGNDDFTITTIEHFMAAFYALGITNLYIRVSGNEMPILDGSSMEIVEGLEKAGIESQNAFNDIFYIPYPIWTEENGSYLIVLPNSSFKITYTIDFNSKSKAVGTQTAHYLISPESFKRSIAPARTFGFDKEWELLKQNNLALGGSLDNGVLFTKEGLVNESLRFENEPVRHKILDLIGDLSLIGPNLAGHFIAYKAGHSLDMSLVQKIDRVIKRKKRARVVSKEILRRKEFEFNRFKKKVNL